MNPECHGVMNPELAIKQVFCFAKMPVKTMLCDLRNASHPSEKKAEHSDFIRKNYYRVRTNLSSNDCYFDHLKLKLRLQWILIKGNFLHLLQTMLHFGDKNQHNAICLIEFISQTFT